MTQTELQKVATEYATKALRTMEGKDPSPEKVRGVVGHLVRKFGPITKHQ